MAGDRTVLDAALAGDLDIDALIEAKRAPTIGESLQGAGANLGNALAGAVTTGNAALVHMYAKGLGAVGMADAARVTRDIADQIQKMQPGFQTAPQMANQGGVGAALTEDLPAGLGSVAGMALTPGVGGPLARAAVQGSLQGFGQGFYEAKAHGADDEVAYESALLNAGLGASEGLFGASKRLASILARVDAKTGGGVREYVIKAIGTGASEFSQESLQQMGANVIAQELYDEDRALFQNVIESGRGGALTGLLIGAVAGFDARRNAAIQEGQAGVEGIDTATMDAAPLEAGAGVEGAVPTVEAGAAPLSEPPDVTYSGEFPQYEQPRAEVQPPERPPAPIPEPKGQGRVESEPNRQREVARRQAEDLIGRDDLDSLAETAAAVEDTALREQFPGREESWYENVADLRRKARDPENIEGDRAALALKRLGIKDAPGAPYTATQIETARRERAKIEKAARDAAKATKGDGYAKGVAMLQARNRAMAEALDRVSNAADPVTAPKVRPNLEKSSQGRRVEVELPVPVDDDGLAEYVIPDVEAQPEPASKLPDGYIDEADYRRVITGTYFDEDGNKKASSRTTPVEAKLPAVGTWRVDSVKGLYGREVAQLREVPVDSLISSELDEKGRVEPAKAGDVERYAEWRKKGLRAPPIEVVETAKGELKVTDGTRRLTAARLTGAKTIEAWVSPTMPHPEGLKESGGDVMRVGMTFEHQMDAEPSVVEPEPATPAEVEIPPPPSREEVETAYGISNAAMEEDMARIGQPYPTKVESITWENENKKASEAFAVDPEVGNKLVDELLKSPRGMTTAEEFILIQESVRRNLDFNKASDALAAAAEAGQDTTPFKARVDAASDRMAALERVSGIAGGLQSQAFRARAAMLREDFSLAGLERMARNAQEGKPLDEPTRATLRALGAKIREAQARLDEYVGASNRREFTEVADDAVAQVAEATAKAGPGKVIEFLDRQAEAARKRIRARTFTAGAGLDPFAIADYAIIAAQKIAHGVADLRAAMVQEFGKEIEPDLDAIEARAREIHANSPQTQSRVKAFKTRKRNELGKIRRQIAERNFAKQERRPLPLDEEALTLKAEVEKAKLEAKMVVRSIEAANRTKAKKALDAVQEMVDINRDLITSFDLSAVGRQGLFFTASNPIQSAKLAGQMLRAMKSEDYALKTDIRIRNRPGHEFAEASGLVLTDLNGELGPREEFIRSKLAKKIPGLRGSNRAFITFINLQRAAMFDAMVRGVDKPTLADGKALARGVNIGTGRGSGGTPGFERFLTEAGRLLWSPRLLMSRFQLIAGQPLWHGTPASKNAFAKAYARALVSLSAVYSLAHLMGGELEDDPRDSDFGKIQIGNTRVDPLGGLAQVSVFLSRTGAKSLETALSQFDVNLGGDDIPRDFLENFMRSKLTPALGTAYNIVKGENVVGEKTTPASVAEDLTIPLSMRDISEELEELGVAPGVAVRLLALFGVGVSTYGSK